MDFSRTLVRVSQGIVSALPSLIAVAGTLLGALVAGIFGLLQLRRQLRWQRDDAERRYRLETERWAHSLLEERDQALWHERRTIYSRILVQINARIDAIRDLSEIDLPKGVEVSNRWDAEKASPVAWAAMQSADDLDLALKELRIIGHPEIIEQVHKVQLRLISMHREALEGKPDLLEAHVMTGWLADQMWVRLTRQGSPMPPGPPTQEQRQQRADDGEGSG